MAQWCTESVQKTPSTPSAAAQGRSGPVGWLWTGKAPTPGTRYSWGPSSSPLLTVSSMCVVGISVCTFTVYIGLIPETPEPCVSEFKYSRSISFSAESFNSERLASFFKRWSSSFMLTMKLFTGANKPLWPWAVACASLRVLWRPLQMEQLHCMRQRAPQCLSTCWISMTTTQPSSTCPLWLKFQRDCPLDPPFLGWNMRLFSCIMPFKQKDYSIISHCSGSLCALGPGGGPRRGRKRTDYNGVTDGDASPRLLPEHLHWCPPVRGSLGPWADRTVPFENYCIRCWEVPSHLHFNPHSHK